MNIIFKPTTFTWYQLGALKWAVFLIGIAVGATWPQFLTVHAVTFLVIGLILSGYVGMVWLRQR